MPQINEYGSVSVEGIIDIRNKNVYNLPGFSISFQEENIELENTTIYTIHKINKNINKVESGFEMDGGLYRKEVEIKLKKARGIIYNESKEDHKKYREG